MLTYLRMLKDDRRGKSERGASAVEYGLLLAGIAAVIMFSVYAFGATLEITYETTCANVSDGVTGGSC